MIFNQSVSIISAVFLVFPLGCGARHKDTTPEGGCSSGIEYQGRTLDIKASFKEFGINAGSRNEVMREVSDTMKIYFEEAANLCSLYDRGELSALEYADMRETLSSRFTALANINKSNPPEAVQENEKTIYLETLSSLKKVHEKSPVKMSLSVSSRGQPLKNGDTLNSGDPFRLQVDLPQRSFLYVILIDSSGALSKLYPSALTGTENPLQGTIAIPTDIDSSFLLDENPGTEKIFVFVQNERSPTIESNLKEVASVTQTDEQARKAEIVSRGINVRKNLSSQVADDAGALSSKFGMLASEFVIEHR